MKCPVCGKAVDPKDENAPFCGDRCRLIDLGKWASGDYVISTIPLDHPKSETDDE